MSNKTANPNNDQPSAEDIIIAEEPTVIFKNIQALCKEKNFTVSSLEEAAGLPTGTIPNWNKTRRWMKYIQAVAKTLGVSIDRLFLDDPALTACLDEDVRTQRLRILNAMEDLCLDDIGVNTTIEVAKILNKNYKRPESEH